MGHMTIPLEKQVPNGINTGAPGRLRSEVCGRLEETPPGRDSDGPMGRTLRCPPVRNESDQPAVTRRGAIHGG